MLIPSPFQRCCAHLAIGELGGLLREPPNRIRLVPLDHGEEEGRSLASLLPETPRPSPHLEPTLCAHAELCARTHLRDKGVGGRDLTIFVYCIFISVCTQRIIQHSHVHTSVQT